MTKKKKPWPPAWEKSTKRARKNVNNRKLKETKKK